MNEGDIILKNRKGNKLAESYSEDIYNLSVFYLDRTFIDPLNELFTVGIKPQVLIKERQEKEKLTIRLKEKSDSNLVKRDKDMSTTETILKEILEKINNVNKKVDGVVVKQDLMQIQLDANSENINKLNESIAISKLENSMDIDIITGNGKKRRIYESIDKKETKYTNHDHNKSAKSLEINKKVNTNIKRDKKPKSVMIGSNESSKVKIATKTFETFVGNLHLDSCETDIVDMFSKNNIKIIKYGEIPTRLQRARAYRVSISYEDKDKIFDSSLWPKGVAMSKFFIKDDRDKYFNMNNKIQPKSSSSPKVNARGDDII